MRKALLVVNSDPVVKEIAARFDERRVFTMKRVNALQAEIKKIVEDMWASEKPEWKAIEKRVKSLGLLPDGYNRDWTMTMNQEEGVLYTTSPDHEEKSDLPDFIKKMLT